MACQSRAKHTRTAIVDSCIDLNAKQVCGSVGIVCHLQTRGAYESSSQDKCQARDFVDAQSILAKRGLHDFRRRWLSCKVISFRVPMGVLWGVLWRLARTSMRETTPAVTEMESPPMGYPKRATGSCRPQTTCLRFSFQIIWSVASAVFFYC